MPVRVHEISKKWGIDSGVLLDLLADLGIDAASHSSAISDEDVAILAKEVVRRRIKPGAKRAPRKHDAKKAAAKQQKPAKDAKAPSPSKTGRKGAETGTEQTVGIAEPEVAEAQKPAGVAAPEEAVPAAVEPAVIEAAGAEVAEAAGEAPAKKAVIEEAQAGQAPSVEAGVPQAPIEKAAVSGQVAPVIIRKIPLERIMRRPPPKKPLKEKEPEKITAIDENLLREQMAQAAQIAQKESEEESRILRRIILPPRKKAKKKSKLPLLAESQIARKLIVTPKPVRVELILPVTVRDFSRITGVKSSQVIKKLMDMGTMAGVNDAVTEETAEMLGMELGVEIVVRKGYDPEAELAKLEQPTADPGKLVRRPPVVTLLGHVDHGKTSLLDAIRHSDVAAREFGGITQHIGAYRVTTDSGHVVTFLDTPGHEAFTEMRARGANVTDIVILVVAADDGVMPQTVEAINHAKAANVPIVVAANKIDKPEADVERVKRQMTNYALLAEEWGGDTMFAPVSALTGKGVDGLLEMLSLQAEMLELSADVSRPAYGTVLEARRTEGKGIVVTVLVQQGTLHCGDVILGGGAYGRVRSLADERGKIIREALPSMPVEVSGFGGVPDAGDKFYVLDDPQKAREIAERRLAQRQEEARVPRRHVSLENLAESFRAGGAKELRIILKADVQGSLEVIKGTLADLSVPEISVRLIHSGIGGINESDVLLADASDAIVVGFNVVAEAVARVAAERKNIEIRLYSVIYHLVEEMKAALESRLDPEIREVIRGHAEVRETFKVSRVGTIAGCMVADGVVTRKSSIRLARQGIVVYEGQIESLRHFKDDVRDVREGFECGIKIAGFDDVKVGDVLEAYETEKVARKIY